MVAYVIRLNNLPLDVTSESLEAAQQAAMAEARQGDSMQIDALKTGGTTTLWPTASYVFDWTENSWIERP